MKGKYRSREIIQSLIRDGVFTRIGIGIPYTRVTGQISKLCDGWNMPLLIPTGASAQVMTLTGGGASGKSTLSEYIIISLMMIAHHAKISLRIEVICTDAFLIGNQVYRDNFQTPRSGLDNYDFALLRKRVEQIKTLVRGQSVTVPVYNPKTGAGIPVPGYCEGDEFLTAEIKGRVDLLILEGDVQPLDDVQYPIYLHVPDPIRLERRLNQESTEHGYWEARYIVNAFHQQQETHHFPYTLPISNQADWLLIQEFDTASVNENVHYDVYVKTVLLNRVGHLQ